MTDRAKVPKSIPSTFKNVYKQLCEQQSPPSIARSTIFKLEKDIRAKGNEANKFVEQIASFLEPYNQDTLFRGMKMHWDEVHRDIDKVADNIDGDRRYMELAKITCHRAANQLEKGQFAEDLRIEMKKQFWLDWLNARFLAKIPLQADHYAGASYELIRIHISKTKPFLEQSIENKLLGVSYEPDEDVLEMDIMNGDI